MTRTRMAIAVTAALAAVHLLAVVAFLDDPDRIRQVHDAGGWAASLFGAFGAVMAARAFAPGDHLRKVWGLLAVGASLLVAGHAIRSAWINTSPEILFPDSPLVYSRLVVVVAANVAQTWGVILLAYIIAIPANTTGTSPIFEPDRRDLSAHMLASPGWRLLTSQVSSR